MQMYDVMQYGNGNADSAGHLIYHMDNNFHTGWLWPVTNTINKIIFCKK